MNRGTISALAVALALLFSQATLAQAPPSPPAASAAASSQQLLADAQLDALVSPIALYPDALLSQILIASTYPLEVVQADRWLKANKNLQSDAVKAAVDQQSWDDSVKSLVATPEVLDMMSQKLDWTQKLGDAVLAQQPDVMDAIQRLRTKAQANNKLTSNKQQKVSTQQQSGKQVVVIEPTDPNTIYVPYYDPAVVYGPWPYPAYPPYYWPAPGYVAAGVLATGVAFGAGYALGRWVSGGNYWGGSFNWTNNNINIDRNGNRNWVHNSVHRQGVRYSNANVAQKFGGNRISGSAQNRMDFRGRGGQQVLQAGAGAALGASAGAALGTTLGGTRGAAGARPSTGDLKPSGRPSGGERPSAKRTAVASRGPSNNAFGNISSGRRANIQAARGRASLGSGGPRVSSGGGISRGAGRAIGRGGGFGGGFARGGRRSDVRLKHDISLLGRLDNGIGIYRFIYNGGDTAYVGVIAQQVRGIMPEAVVRGRDGYLRVHYEKLGLKFETYDQWVASGAQLPIAAGVNR